MTDKTLRKYIHMLNKEGAPVSVFKRFLSNEVDHAYVWIKPSPGVRSTPLPTLHQFYFIKSEGYYVAAVYDMVNDLHAYVVPSYRKKGHLGKALYAVILPHLLSRRETINVTVNVDQLTPKMAKRSEHVTRKMGFSFVRTEGGKKLFELRRGNFPGPRFNEKPDAFICPAAIAAVLPSLIHATRLVTYAWTQLESAAGVNEYTLKLRGLVEQMELQAKGLRNYTG